jgi:type I restriction enzyme M protein
MVRDGTYLIGTAAYVTEHDTRIVYQSHLYKLRLTPDEDINPFLLLAMLSSRPVRAQIRSLAFTQDIIDSLGDRIREVILPIPRSAARRLEITDTVGRVISDRVEARELARQATLLVVS